MEKNTLKKIFIFQHKCYLQIAYAEKQSSYPSTAGSYPTVIVTNSQNTFSAEVIPVGFIA